MKARRNRILSLMLTASMAFSTIFPSAAVWAEDFDSVPTEAAEDTGFIDDEFFEEPEFAGEFFDEGEVEELQGTADDFGEEAEEKAEAAEEIPATLNRIQYTGDEVGFFKEDGTSAFGMLSAQDGSEFALDGDEVKIFIVPSNKTVYGWIHWGFITDEELTKDVAFQDETNNIVLSVSKENCGYGIPIAPIKKSDGKTSSAQYYLCIPTEDKLPSAEENPGEEKADYTAVDAALEKVPLDLSGYTEESAKAVTDAKNAVVRDKSAAEQAEVDAMAKAIEDAVAALESTEQENDGRITYTGSEVGFYKKDGESAFGMLSPQDGSTYVLEGDEVKISIIPKNTTVYGWIHWGFITDEELTKDVALQEDGYIMSVSKENCGYGIPVAPIKYSDGKTTGEQYYLCIPTEDKLQIAEEDPGEEKADYTAVDAALEKVPSDLSGYTEESAKAVTDAVNAVVRDKSAAEQADVDAMAEAIEAAVAALVKAEVKVEVAFSATDNKTGASIGQVAFVVEDKNGNAIEAVDGKYPLTAGASYKITISAPDYRETTVNYTADAEESEKTFGVWHLNYNYTLQVCLAEKQYAESTPAGSNRGETVTIQKIGEEPKIVTTEASNYTLDNLEPGATYTIRVEFPGNDVIISDEWNIEKHGYYFETEESSVWEKTVTIVPIEEGGKEHIDNLLARFLVHEEKTEIDFSKVDEAIAEVPGSLRLFTTDTADALRTAVNAVDRDVKSQEEADAMADAITTALQGLLPKDGSYEVTIEKYNGTPYYLYEGLGDSDKAAGKAVLIVEDGKMSAALLLKNQSYGQVYLGTKDAAIDAANEAGRIPDGAIEITLNSEMSTVNGKQYKSSSVTVPVPALQAKIDYAYHSSNATRYDHTTGWYDHSVKYLANSLTPVEVQKQDETINLSIFDEELMFKAVNAFVEIKDGKAELVFCLSAKGYEDIFAGTFDEAIANGNNKENWIHYTKATVDCVYETKSGKQNDGTSEKYQFRVPVELNETGETRVPVVAISHSKQVSAESANPENPDYSAAFTARQAVIDIDAASVRFGNYRDEYEVKVKSSIDTFAVEESGSLYISGTPLANEYTCQPTITMKDDTYDRAFIGSAADAENAEESALISIGEDKSFVLKIQNSYDSGKTQIIDGKAVVAFHVKDTGEWIDREIIVDTEARTITINGEEISTGPKELVDGTYTAKNVITDVTTETSGMIMVTNATVVIKDGQATAVVTMKGTGADRFYVSDTATKDTIIAEAIAEEKKEVGGEEGNLLGGLKLEGSSAYTFWPVPITLGEPKVYAARSATHFSKQDLAPEKYYYVHDFQINAEDLVFVNETTDLPITPEQEAQRYLNQYFLDGKVVTSATAASVTGKNANVTIPYYDVNDQKINSFIFKMADSAKFRSGWFVDKSILNTTYFSSSNLKKIRYPEGSSGKVTFSPKPAYRDEGMNFTAVLRLYPVDAGYNQYDADEVYYDKAPLAEQEFHITVQPLPEDRKVTIKVVDSVSKEEIANAVVTVTKEDGTGTTVEKTDGIYALSVPGSYTITVSAEGYLVPGTEETVLTEAEYVPKKESETLTLNLVKAEESKNTITFSLKDQMEEPVVDPELTVYRWDNKAAVAPETDGSYKLYYGVRYGYTVKAEGYEEKSGSLNVSGDAEESVLVNKYLSEQKFTFRVYDAASNETLEDVELEVKYGPASAEESTYAIAQPDENKVYTIPIDNRVIAYGKKTGYANDSLGVWSLGFDPVKNCSFSMKMLPDADYTAVDEAIAAKPEELSVYTEESVKAVEDAVAAVVRGKKTDEQEIVDAMAKAIADAVAALQKKPTEQTATPTPTPAATATPTPTPVVTAAPIATATPTPAATAAPTSTPAATPTPAPAKAGTKLSNDGAVYKVLSGSKKVSYAGPTSKNVKTVEIPDTVKVDGITYKVTTIQAKAFANCKKLVKVTVGKNITTIEAKAFYNCTSLKKVVIQKNVTTIGEKAFANCKVLTSVTIKSSKIKTIGKNAFYKAGSKNYKKLAIKVPKKKLSTYKKKLQKAKLSKKAKVKK